MARRVSALPLVLILFLAAALRVAHIDSESVWLDEAFSITVARTTVPNILEQTALDVHPPLYYVLLFLWTHVAGTSTAAARMLSTTLGLAVIVAAYGFARRFLNLRVAMIAALLLAVTPFQVEFSQEARMYTLLTLLSTMAMHAFMALFDRQSRVWAAVLATATGLLLYTHVYGLFTVAAQAGVLAWEWRRGHSGARRIAATWMRCLAGALIMFAPWLAIFLFQTFRVQEAFWIERLPWYGFLHPLLVYAGSIPLAVTYFAAVMLGGYRLATRPQTDSRPTAPALLLWTAVPIMLPFLLSAAFRPIFLAKYTIAGSVPYALLAAVGVSSIDRRAWRRAALALLLALAGYGLFTFYTKHRKNDWRTAAAQLEASARPGDLVVFYPHFQQIPFDFYKERTDLVERPLTRQPVLLSPGEVPEAVARVSNGRTRFWLVALAGEPVMPEMLETLNRDFVTVQRSYSTGVTTYLFERRP